jgi:hypothetical protein
VNRIRFETLKENIESTIGSVNFEIIGYNNEKLNHSISNVYNKGSKLSKFPYLLFVHEDISFKTTNWGIKLLEIFSNNPQVGVLGVAGTKILPNAPAGWFNTPEEFHVKNILQKKSDKTIHENIGFNNLELIEVASIDGVFIAFKKSDLAFPTDIKGFHGYDLAISIEHLNAGCRNFVTNQILIEHFSEGKTNQEWISAMYIVWRKYSKKISRRYLFLDRRINRNIWIQFIHRSFDSKLKNIARKACWHFFLQYPLNSENLNFLYRIFRS